ncbi:MAG TPA: MarR family transcriptional regulator [Bryobacteraceae bacterium]|jgi:DNA-binding MarR family transcriptional regulator|nr:MarR family transcriptional regulator [Bryobacteraceae bacterium]
MAQEIDQHLHAVRRTLQQPVEAEFARGGLTGPQRSVMQALVKVGGLSVKETSRQVGLAHSTVSGIVDRLERQGLVERQKDKEDHRVNLIVPSKAVRDYVRDTLPTLVVHPLAGALQRAKPAERRAILEGLRTLRRVLS